MHDKLTIKARTYSNAFDICRLTLSHSLARSTRRVAIDRLIYFEWWWPEQEKIVHRELTECG